MKVSEKFHEDVKESLSRELYLCSEAANFYTRNLRVLEKKYRMTTLSFLKKFEEGKLGDDQDFFDWYAFHRLLSRWKDTKKSLQHLVK